MGPRASGWLSVESQRRPTTRGLIARGPAASQRPRGRRHPAGRVPSNSGALIWPVVPQGASTARHHRRASSPGGHNRSLRLGHVNGGTVLRVAAGASVRKKSEKAGFTTAPASLITVVSNVPVLPQITLGTFWQTRRCWRRRRPRAAPARRLPRSCRAPDLTTGTPSSVPPLGATTLYYTPYIGNSGRSTTAPTYVDSPWRALNITTNSGRQCWPAAVVASSNYDLFVWSNAGTPTLVRVPHGPPTRHTRLRGGPRSFSGSMASPRTPWRLRTAPAPISARVGTVRLMAVRSSTGKWARAGGTAAFLNVWNVTTG